MIVIKHKAFEYLDENRFELERCLEKQFEYLFNIISKEIEKTQEGFNISDLIANLKVKIHSAVYSSSRDTIALSYSILSMNNEETVYFILSKTLNEVKKEMLEAVIHGEAEDFKEIDKMVGGITGFIKGYRYIADNFKPHENSLLIYRTTHTASWCGFDIEKWYDFTNSVLVVDDKYGLGKTCDNDIVYTIRYDKSNEYEDNIRDISIAMELINQIEENRKQSDVKEAMVYLTSKAQDKKAFGSAFIYRVPVDGEKEVLLTTQSLWSRMTISGSKFYIRETPTSASFITEDGKILTPEQMENAYNKKFLIEKLKFF